MQIGGYGHNPIFSSSTGEGAITTQVKRRGPCPKCKQYHPELKLVPFAKHYHDCKGEVNQRKIKHQQLNGYTCASKNARQHIHTDKQLHECELCNKRFSFKHNLIRHYRTHTGEKPYDCKQCDKRFSNKHNLTRHNCTHTGVKPYECQQCAKAFFNGFNLKRHMAKH